MPGPQRFAGPSRFPTSAPYRAFSANRPGARASYNYGRPTGNWGRGDRDRDRDGRRFRRPYISSYFAGYSYAPWIWPGYYGFPDWLDYDDSYDTSNQYDPNQYNPGYAANSGVYGDQGDWNPPQQPEPWPSYGPYGPQPSAPPTSQPQSQAAPLLQQTVTLIFKDGRAPEHVRNYLLTPTTLYVGDSARHEIPLSQLDLAATEQANADAGVDFHLPQPLN